MLEFGTIVLVPFPFTDYRAIKVRPALVVSKSDRMSRDVVLCFITSRIDQKNFNTLSLKPNEKNGLKLPSMVRFDKIATVERSIILGELGRMDPAILRKHQQKFFEVFGF